ncbi:MAG: four helix bundle protein [Deltaproteobacteria bacterium]|nr:four helix bundle protein [Deltaproteobacteria bacterium]
MLFALYGVMQVKFRTYEFSVQFARLCRTLDVPPDLKDQLDRASASITLNLREGSGRYTPKDRFRFYRTALSSFRECEAIFDIIDLKNEKVNELKNTLGGSLNCLCRATKPQ